MPATPNSAPGPIVAGVERTERSRDALALARTLARAVGTHLIVVAVSPVEAAALAEEGESTRTLPCTSVSRGLQRVAEEEGALAIVVAPGSVGERLLRSASCPVAVAPSGYGSQTSGIRRIGLGFVATPEADEALCAAIGIALRTGAAIQALSVVELPAAVSMGFGWDYLKLEELARENLSRALVRTLGDVTSPVDISGEVVDGYADDELARLSEDVDLLVCGSRGLGPVGRVMLGSVAAGVMRKARCPVLVIPRGAPDGFATLRPPVPAAA
jgi:nucleotide-binding universal stress UspA family protein